MTRSLFLALLLRLLAGFAAAALVLVYFRNGWALGMVCVAVAIGIAWWCARATSHAAAGLVLPADSKPKWSAFDRPAALLRAASEGEDRRLAQTVAGRQELEALLDSMTDAVVAVDAANRIQWSNAPMRQLVSGSGARLGHSLVNAIRDPDVLACVRTALEWREPAEVRATSILPGRTFTVSASPMPGGGAVAVLHDVTDMEQMERAQRDFVANVSHELRTPLTSITGYVETLLEDEFRGEDDTESDTMVRDFLFTIQKNAARMNRLTEDLLVLARFESGEHPLRPVRVRASSLVRETLDALAVVVRDTEATLSVDGPADLEVFADTDAVIRVLSNLIENALKYGRGAGPARVAVRYEADEPGMVRFSVQDWGAGIASEHIGRLFERFYRVDKARSRESGGTGLGLAIARRLTESQGGRVWVESELRVGSTFCFTLPAAIVMPAVDAHNEVDREDGDTTAAASKTAKHSSAATVAPRVRPARR